jgi:hypothetical protein
LNDPHSPDDSAPNWPAVLGEPIFIACCKLVCGVIAAVSVDDAEPVGAVEEVELLEGPDVPLVGVDGVGLLALMTVGHAPPLLPMDVPTMPLSALESFCQTCAL